MRHEAINNLYPNVASQTNNLAFDAQGNKITVDESKVAEEVERLQAEYDSKQYHRDRAISYPSLQDQLDMQYWDSVNGTTTWKDAIAKVKTDIPKPE